jgi:hypothetical protein
MALDQAEGQGETVKTDFKMICQVGLCIHAHCTAFSDNSKSDMIENTRITIWGSDEGPYV